MHDETVLVLQSIATERRPVAHFALDLTTLPHAALTYAQAGEDIAREGGGTYVDIGCADPLSMSNTHLFYCMGWRGLCVDANPKALPVLKERRPDDSFVSAAVAEQDGQTNLFFHRENLGMHRIGDVPPSPDFDPMQHIVPTKRLEDLLETHLSGRTIQIMNLDVEGAEMGVLRSNNWGKWRPEVTAMECEGFDSLAPRAIQSVTFLLDRDYRLEAKISGNVVLIA